MPGARLVKRPTPPVQALHVFGQVAEGDGLTRWAREIVDYLRRLERYADTLEEHAQPNGQRDDMLALLVRVDQLEERAQADEAVAKLASVLEEELLHDREMLAGAIAQLAILEKRIYELEAGE